MHTATIVSSSGGADMCGTILSGNGTYTSNSSSYKVTVSTGSHCCACAGVCLHTGGPFYCANHSYNGWQNWDSDNTVPWNPAPTNPWAPQPVINPLPATPPTITFPEVKCFICKENLPLEEMLAGEKVCEGCRTTIEAFKTILVKEKDEGGSK